MQKKKRYVAMVGSASVKKRMEDEIDDLAKSIKKNTTISDFSGVNTYEDLMKVLERTEFAFASEWGLQKDKENLFKHPIIQDLIKQHIKIKEIDSIRAEVTRREPTLNNFQVNNKADEIFEYRFERRKAKGHLTIAKEVKTKITRKEQLNALTPARRSEELVFVNKYGKTKQHSRSRPLSWSEKQINFLIANKKKDRLDLVSSYNSLFKEKRTPQGISKEMSRLGLLR